MAVAHVQTSSVANDSGVTSSTLTFGAGVTSGSTIMLALVANESPTVSGCGATWTRKTTQTNSIGHPVELWVGSGATSGTTVTLTFTTARYVVAVADEFSGVVSVGTGTAAQATTSVATPSQTLSTGDVAYATISWQNNPTATFTDSPAAWTTVAGAFNPSISNSGSAAYRIATGSETASRTVTLSDGSQVSVISVRLSATSGGTASTSGTWARGARSFAGAASTGVVRSTSLTAARTARSFTASATAGSGSAATMTRSPRGFGLSTSSVVATAGGRPDATTATGWARTDRSLLVAADTDDPVAAPPLSAHVRRYLRSSYSITPPTFAADGWSHPNQTRTLIDGSEVGRHRFRLGGVDRTYPRGVPVQLIEDSHANPFGHETCVLFFPQFTAFERPGVGYWSWLHNGTGLRVSLVRPDGSNDPSWTWSGYAHNLTPAWRGDTWGLEVEFKGFLYMTDDAANKPLPTAADSQRVDIGERVAKTLNVTAHHYPAIQAVTTSIGTRKRGSLSQTAMSFVRDLLADAWTTDGRQWTVMTAPTGQSASIQLPDPSTVDYTISVGQDGVTFDLSEENDDLPNVIYGEWIDADGGRHQRLKWPRLHEDAAPAFPLTVGSVFNPGSGTTGFQPFSDWMRRNGFAGFDSQDTYLASDSDDVGDAQKRMGITVDGIVGAQTWGTAFNTGADLGDLNAAIYLPIAWDPRVEPWLYAPDGTRLGANPAYDVQVRRQESYVNFGEGLDYRDVRRAAQQIVNRSLTGISLVGEITCETDPEETSWLKAFAGKTLRARYLYGSGSTGVSFHIARLHRSYDTQTAKVTTTLAVDTKWRDAYTVTQIIERNRASRDDPARKLRRRQSSGVSQDTKIQFDADVVGRIYPHALQGGFWRVVQFPAASWGTFVRVVATTSPAVEFALGLFDSEITPRDLDRLVGNPLATGNTRPWTPGAPSLAAAGLIQAWGSSVQPGGYSKVGAADGYKSDTDPLTGRLEYDSNVDFAPANGASLFLAEWVSASTTMSARLYLAPVEF